MPTNDERREVAETLRSGVGTTDYMSDDDFIDWVHSVVSRSRAGHILDRLADLIEPEERTCRMEPTGDGSVVCSACRTEYTSRWLHDGEYVERYCPNCGARVVDADA